MSKHSSLTTQDLEKITASKADRYSSYSIAGMVMSGYPEDVVKNSITIKDNNGQIVNVCFIENKDSLKLEENKKIHIARRQ